MSRRRFTRIALAVWLLGLTATALFNVVVDPYCAYQIAPDWFADYKPAYQRAETKAELILSRKPTSLILGTSRSLVFDPRWKEWQGENAFNLGIPSASQEEVAATLKFAVRAGTVKRVLMCICFSQFGRPGSLAPFDRSKFSTKFAPWSYHVQNMLSWDAFAASFDTLRDYVRQRPSSYTSNGMVRDGKFPLKGSHHKQFTETMRQYDEVYGVYKPSRKAFAALRSIVRMCRERRIELTVVVSPVHVLHLETAAAKGLWTDYERWLHDAAVAVDQESGGKVHLWDFGGYNKYTTEPAPIADDAPALVYHQESSHFTPAMARKVLDRAFHSPDADPEFGHELTCENIDARIAQLRAERAEWLGSRPAALALLGEVFPKRLAEAPVDGGRLLK